ncbi:SPOR domain-containing protein [Parahaliea mediterranea]|uniref:SPOR domain-containing protein n=1 Tax=Parahaliea mediterranea TaxID=651086 RepID=UPI000E2FEFCB|nr:SPOR domain-containing protein [Parahaliea mediterranea]
MSNHSDNGNPFSPSRRPHSDSDPSTAPATDDWRRLDDDNRDDIGDDSHDEKANDNDGDDYPFDYRADDDYDPDELLDDVEEPAAGSAWPDPTAGMSAAGYRPAASKDRDDLFEDDDPADDDDDAYESRYDPASDDRDDPDDDEASDDEDDDGEDSDDDHNDADADDEDDGSDDWEDYEDKADERGLLGPWPLGLIAAGAVALLLLAVGGFGVLQERASLREEIRELRAELAVAVNPDQLSQERSTQRELVERNESLAASLDSLRLENRQLSDTVAGLERQLQAQQAAVEQAREAAPSRPAAKPATKPATQPAATAPASATGDWFVNFGSYRQRALADSWAKRLQPAAGKVVVQAAPGGDLYRVRIIALPDKATAQSVAKTLQARHDLSELWVGED